MLVLRAFVVIGSSDTLSRNAMETQQETTPDRYAHLNRSGRKPGVPNRTTQSFRETVTKLLEDNSANVGVWLERVSQNDPGKALDLLAKLAEFAAPKLSKVEQTSEVNITHGYAFQIERPARPALEGESTRVHELPDPINQGEPVPVSAKIRPIQPVDK